MSLWARVRKDQLPQPGDIVEARPQKGVPQNGVRVTRKTEWGAQCPGDLAPGGRKDGRRGWVRETFSCLPKICESERKWSCSVVSDSLWPHGLEPTRLLRSWNFPGKNTRVSCHFLLQVIFPAQGLNPGLLHCRQTLYHLSHLGRPTPLPAVIFFFLYCFCIFCFLYNFVFIYCFYIIGERGVRKDGQGKATFLGHLALYISNLPPALPGCGHSPLTQGWGSGLGIILFSFSWKAK